MSEFVLALVANYDVPIVFCVTFLSCLALPVPSSILMLASGGFAATGDLSLVTVVMAALCGAVLGDNCGYWLARVSGGRMETWLAASPNRNALRAKAQNFMTKWGGSSVFFSRWLVAPIGPYINYVSGLTELSWLRFALWSIAGEVVWVCVYVGAGYSFAGNITTISSILGNASGFLTALAVVIGLGAWLTRASNST